MADHTILLVDDEPRILRALERLLRKEGYDLLTAESGEAGLELVQQHKVHVMVSDQRMPGMSGLELLIEARKVHPDVVGVLVSGYLDVNLITEAVNTGEIYRFVAKPWNDDQLKRLIRRSVEHFELVLDNRRLQEELRATNEELRELNQHLEQRVLERARELFIHNRALLLSQEVLDRLPSGVVGINEDGTVVLANAAAGELLACASSGARPVIGEPFPECLPESVAGLVSQTMSSRERIEAGVLPLAGRWLDVRLVPLGQDDDSRGAILVAHNVTDILAGHCAQASARAATP